MVRPRSAGARAALLATTLVVLGGVPAGAHPFVAGGGRVPVDSLATIELDLAHGCGVETTGLGAATDEVALEVPAWLHIVAVPEPSGWTVTREDAAPPATGAVVWTATTATDAAPRFVLDVVVAGLPGETRHLRVSQRCGATLLRWSGTPDEPAERPAVRLRLEPADPDRPPPPATDGDGAVEAPEAVEAVEDGDPAPPATPEPAPGTAPTGAPAIAPGPGPAVARGPDDRGGLRTVLTLVAATATVAILTTVVAMRRRGRSG